MRTPTRTDILFQRNTEQRRFYQRLKYITEWKYKVFNTVALFMISDKQSDNSWCLKCPRPKYPRPSWMDDLCLNINNSCKCRPNNGRPAWWALAFLAENHLYNCTVGLPIVCLLRWNMMMMTWTQYPFTCHRTLIKTLCSFLNATICLLFAQQPVHHVNSRR